MTLSGHSVEICGSAGGYPGGQFMPAIGTSVPVRHPDAGRRLREKNIVIYINGLSSAKSWYGYCDVGEGPGYRMRFYMKVTHVPISPIHGGHRADDRFQDRMFHGVSSFRRLQTAFLNVLQSGAYAVSPIFHQPCDTTVRCHQITKSSGQCGLQPPDAAVN